MAKATKKELNAVLAPLFKEYDRFALGLTSSSAPRIAKPKPIHWRGYDLDIQVVKRGKVVCGVPFPFAVFEFWYEAKRDGKLVVQVGDGGRPSFINALFRYSVRNNIEL